MIPFFFFSFFVYISILLSPKTETELTTIEDFLVSVSTRRLRVFSHRDAIANRSIFYFFVFLFRFSTFFFPREMGNRTIEFFFSFSPTQDEGR